MQTHTIAPEHGNQSYADRLVLKSIGLIAARYRLGLESGSSLRGFAEELMVKGHEESAVVRLAILDEDELSEAGPLFEAVCRQLELEPPSLGDSVRIAAGAEISEIADGHVEPRVGLGELRKIYEVVRPDKVTDPSLPAPAKTLGGEFGFDRLLGAFWGYDDLLARPTEVSFQGKFGSDAIEALDQFVVSESRAWLNSNCNRTESDRSNG